MPPQLNYIKACASNMYLPKINTDRQGHTTTREKSGMVLTTSPTIEILMKTD
jgi:hypothetical protein